MDIKASLAKMFMDYVKSRESFWGKIITFLFRHKILTKEKIVIAKRVVSEIKQCGSHTQELLNILTTEKEAHAALSRQYNKKHFNLDKECKSASYASSLSHFFVKQGENRNQSKLANVFHSAIDFLSCPQKRK